MRVKRLSHVSLGTTDLDRIVDFYCALVDAEIAHEFRNDAGIRYGVFLATGGGTFVEIFNQVEPVAAGGLFRHLCFEVEDIEAAAEQARALGLEAAVRRGRTDRVLQFFVTDPDGTIIEFQQHDEQSTLYRFTR